MANWIYKAFIELGDVDPAEHWWAVSPRKGARRDNPLCRGTRFADNELEARVLLAVRPRMFLWRWSPHRWKRID